MNVVYRAQYEGATRWQLLGKNTPMFSFCDERTTASNEKKLLMAAARWAVQH